VSKVVPLQSDIYKILINNKYNNFTIAEFRDELVNCSSTFTDKNLARKFIYRQVYRLINKSLLIKIKNSGGQKARYIKTELFKETSFGNKTLVSDKQLKLPTKDILNTSHSIAKLEREKNMLEESLAITTCEVDVYTELLKNLPDQASHLKKFHLEAKTSSICLTGRINALEKVLSILR
jgi:hypothetical protein